eukprot:gene13100-biopygen3233
MKLLCRSREERPGVLWKKNVAEKLVRLVKSTYYNARIVVRTSYGETSGVQWETLFADDLVLMADSEEELKEKWDVWHEGMAKKGLKVKVKKTKVMVSSRSKTRVNITVKHCNTPLKQVRECEYLGMMVSEEGGSEIAIRA